jgi:hypothetical protein
MPEDSTLRENLKSYKEYTVPSNIHVGTAGFVPRGLQPRLDISPRNDEDV